MNNGKSSSLRGNTSRDRIASASETSSKACPKTLRISPNIQVIPHLALSDYTDEEYDNTWETENDRARSHRHLAETLLLMRNNDGDIPTAHQDDHTSRGLECMASPATLQRSKATKAAVIDAVLDEQERQFDERNLRPAKAFDYDEALMKMANLSMELSREARDCALVRGHRDSLTGRNPTPLTSLLSSNTN